MRVCFVSHTAGKGGAEFALLELLQGLVAEGIDCKVLVPKKGPLLAALDQLGIEWKIIGYPFWVAGARRRWMSGRVLRTARTLLLAVPMAQIITKWKCDLVCSNTMTIGAGALAAWLAKRPHIWHLHEFGYRDPNLLFDLGERRTAQLMDRLSAIFIANSYAVVKHYGRYISQERIKVVYQAVTLRDEIEGLPGNHATADKLCFTCVIVGSLHIAKGQDEAIRALAEVVRRGVDMELLFVGAGNKRFRKVLGQQVRDFGLEQRVKFIGYAENPLPYIRMADVVLVCSRWEAFGRATVEAMLLGKPIIATANSGGTAELIHDEETGLLYEAGNHVELADKIQHLYQNPEAGARLGTAAHVWAAGRFTQQRYGREVIDVLNEVLAEKSSRCPL
ncbi:glycosyltransferase family 4 protein [Nitrosospira sp. Nsp1]|uniref:glycosyltransferase family 4 protein n=1 Tax=Nitrosospira sp. Nsp1 TaxID=136547 RepID=UPI00088DDD7C|nr:glycosyltransferase family 4 protein [Nitrosospira sp. Nsp1]SCX63312.1 Glycosyltransferase involved in cell wall bisynthesis [Nitrosospira sp. Nsp1]